ncbi:hypothetical protein ACFQ12_09275, partial [Methylobacterium trifolii]
MSDFMRRTLLIGSTAGLALLAATAPGHAQRGAPPPSDAIDGYGGYDDDRLYQDQNGALYRRRGGRYEPYAGRVEGGPGAGEHVGRVRLQFGEHQVGPEQEVAGVP